MNDHLLLLFTDINSQGTYMAAALGILLASPYAGVIARSCGIWLYRRAVKVNCRCPKHRGMR